MITASIKALAGPEAGILVNNHEEVSDLQQAVLEAPRNAELLRGTLRSVIREGSWKDRLDVNRGRRYQAESFLKFISDPLPEGLASDPDTLRKFILDDAALLVDFEQAINRGRGGANNPSGKNQHTTEEEKQGEEVNRDNVTVDLNHPSQQPPKTSKGPGDRGNSRDYSIRRLVQAAQGNPEKCVEPNPRAQEALERVRRGEVKVHRALIEAGLKRQPTALEQLQALWKKCSPGEQATAFREAWNLLAPADREAFLSWISEKGEVP